jgi:hypothetical protein
MMCNDLPTTFVPMRDVWFPLDMSNAASFNVIMAHSAAHLALTHDHDYSYKAFEHKSKAIRIINSWLGSPAHRVSDEAFAGVLRLSTYEVIYFMFPLHLQLQELQQCLTR